MWQLYPILCLMHISYFCNNAPHPDHPVLRNNAVENICAAYGALVKIDINYWDSPPELFSLLSIRDGDSDTHLENHILMEVHEKTSQYHDQLSRLRKNSEAYKHAQVMVDSWNMVAYTLLRAEYRKVYRDEVYSVMGWKLKQNLHDMCWVRWKSKPEGDGEGKKDL